MNSPAALVSIASLLFFSAFFPEPSSVVGSASFRGVSPEDLKYFKSKGDVIDCKDGSRKFSRAQLNDDFCDCADGTDEPGTSACPGSKFYCRNAGHVPVFLFSSRVNDGICDCCDGTDEYDGKVNCSNTCWEAGKVARDKLKAKIATYKDGVLIRRQEIEHAKAALVKDEAELTKLQSDEKILKGLVQQLKERKEQIEKAEEEERKRKEEEKLKKESEKKDEQEKKDMGEGDLSQSSEEEDKSEMERGESESTDNDKVGVLEELIPNELKEDDTSESGDENDHAGSKMDTEQLTKNEEQHVLGDEDKMVSQVDAVSGGDEVQDPTDQVIEGGDDSSEPTETMSKEELGRLVANRWTGKSSEKESQEKFEEDNSHEDQSKYNHYEDDDGYASENDNNDQKYEDERTEDEIDDDVDDEYHPHTNSPSTYESEDESDDQESSPTWLEKIQQTVRSILQAVNLFQTPVDKSEADRVRKEYDESSTKLSKMQSRISKLTQKLGLDFGHDKEFYSFYGQCFESKQNKYTYKVCPYKKASQEEGHSTTQLGHWDKFEDSYRTMAFSNGDRCWNGPDRKMTVRLRCGLKNEVNDVDEPSRCEYAAILLTPAVCTEDKLEELQRKLARMEDEQPPSHDEL
ncbi:hypothetical protein MLD38_017109 [Melastoma candidum]|uniref:Uncharacterized protein n=1 Tax=Melastoma candidum TaxID=119954 RepID=A0ACB9QPK5_9MYRT|nr:hypothetical protein MLD38_017109 [Melastoma candidum]